MGKCKNVPPKVSNAGKKLSTSTNETVKSDAAKTLKKYQDKKH